MMITRIERIDERLRSLEKPLLKTAGRLFLEKNGVLVLAAGFEDRALGALKCLAASSSKGFKTILIKYKPFLEENKIKEIKELCSHLESEVIDFEYDRYNPAGGGEKLVNLLGKNQGTILFDISAVSRFLIVQFLVALGKSERNFSAARVVYSEARFYPPTKDEAEKRIGAKGTDCVDSVYHDYFISSGVYELSIVPELSSIASYGQQVRLVVFPSFNCDQLSSLKGEIQPFFFHIINGIPPASENAWRLGDIRKLNHIEDISKRDEMNTSTLDYRETLDYLLTVYNEYTDKDRIVIAPTGSKMQSVAVGIFRTFMNDVQVVYPTPRKYTSPRQYTEGIKNIYTLNLEVFGKL
jgi:hypothetical protein